MLGILRLRIAKFAVFPESCPWVRGVESVGPGHKNEFLSPSPFGAFNCSGQGQKLYRGH